ncbi:PKD domain-containing protein [Tunicatimonas pelagia]|uniref:PKD domain-containing protein n=1 Tax=Tunicatimonas pelagia TaxID=931531 RepID=UPI002666B5E3|nr:PKD domain-containing protein [Tunicatimonas pelagia]WKN40544.1 PKD domain-containing protein [Tunicatimonas pelagia]
MVSQQGWAQCATYSNPGNNVESPPRLCAPHNFEWRVWYTVLGSPTTVELVYDWGDGSPLVTVPAVDVGSGRYEAVQTHLYPEGGIECNYEPSVHIQIDGSLCTNSTQSQSVTVWDTDEDNGGIPRIDPVLYRVCVGETAIVQFDDNSIWNCVPNSGENDRVNNAVRWVQWIYGTGNPASRIPNAQVDGVIRTYDFAGNVEVLPGPIETSTSQSDPITVFGSAVGDQFEVTLRNWNVCNPYDADTTDGDYLNPTLGDLINGDSAFIETQAQIVVVEKSNPDFNTRLSNNSGPIQTEFCAGDTVYFQDLTPAITDADFSYLWEYYDDATGTSLLRTSTNRNSRQVFNNPGDKLIRLTVTDNNSVGNCGGSFEKVITVVETANAAIAVSDLNGAPLPPLCYDPVSPVAVDVKFKDISTNFDPATSEWTWNFFDETGVVAQTTNGDTAPDSLEVSITNPGTYMAELIASATGVDCETRDTAYVHIYAPPTANFTFTAGCQSDSVLLESTATLPTVVNGDEIDLYEWDLDDDGTFETSGEGPFKHLFPVAGTYQVHHRVTTREGLCSDVVTLPITVNPSPYASFTPSVTEGCGPLTVAFAVDTLLVNQPGGVDDYRWYIKDITSPPFAETVTSLPLADTTELLFENTLTSFANQQYEVWLEVDATNGCDAVSQRDTITVFASPPSEYIITNASGVSTNCSPHTFEFEVTAATQSLGADNYVWTVLNESDSSVLDTYTIPAATAQFSYTITNDATTIKQYRVRLQPTSATKCFAPYEELVQVFPAPSSAFDTTFVEADCDVVTYELDAQQKGLFYQWTVSPPPLKNPSYTADRLLVTFEKKNLSYPVNITLKTINGGNGCESDTTEAIINIDPREDINASFTVDPTLLEIPNTTVSITNTTNPGSWAYAWDFGDSTVSNEANPGTHTYTAPGEYMIKLRATGQYCFEEDSALVIVNQTLPRVDFSYTTIEGCLPLEVTFTNTTMYADSSTILWDFGDGTISTEWNPVHTYELSGVYAISLQASNELGVVVREEKTIIVDLSQGPKADFRPRLAQRYIRNEDIFFTNLSQRSDTYFWDFGDGTTSTLEEPTHQYADTGRYDITLIAQNALGCVDTLVKEIIIEPLVPEVDFSYEPPKGCRPLTVQFRNLSRYAEADSYRWSFGEGEGRSTEANPVYTYYEPGFYTVTLEASNSAGVTVVERKEFSVEVYETPRAFFNLRPDKAFLGEPIYFINLSLGAENYYWDFGDGVTSTETNPNHTYETTGSYDITLVAESNQGCLDTIVVESAVLIEEGGTVQVPNAFTPSPFGPSNSEVVGPNGQNDIFLPVFEGVTEFHMMIYNRWGELMFESFDKTQGWNGYYKGRLCPKDAYVYKVKLKFSDGGTRTVVGDVTLLR